MTRTRPDWTKLMQTHNHAVVVSLLARGLKLSAARELASETWALLFERWEQGRLTELEFPGLAIRQAAFLFADAFRARRHESLEGALEVSDCSAGPESVLAAREELALTSHALSRLTPRAREVFTEVMSRPDDSHAEVAQSLGLSLQRLRQTLCEVRARLRGEVRS